MILELFELGVELALQGPPPRLLYLAVTALVFLLGDVLLLLRLLLYFLWDSNRDLDRQVLPLQRVIAVDLRFLEMSVQKALVQISFIAVFTE